MIEISFRGGSRIGWVNASWPLAKLTVGADRLSISSMGDYDFLQNQVVSLEPFGVIPLLASGIRINHNRLDYPEKIIFWCMGNRNNVLAKITQFGFLPSGQPANRTPGIPIRWSVIISFVILWNVLFWLDGSLDNQPTTMPGPFVLLALLSAFLFSTATRISKSVQQIVLSKGHHIGEISAFLKLLQLVSGGLSIGFGVSFVLSRMHT